MDRADFVESRRSGIGGSDVAAVMGLSRFKTPLQVWNQKVNAPMPTQDNEAMAIGRALEPFVLDMYERVTGVKLTRNPETMRHAKYPFIIANLDAYVPGLVVEAKTAFDGRDWGEEGTDEIPPDYYCQTQHYMLVTGYPVADVPVFLRGEHSNAFRVYNVAADEQFQQRMIAACIDFWGLVESRTPPAPVTFEEMAQNWHHQAQETPHIIREANGDDIEDLSRLKTCKMHIATLEEEAERLTRCIQSRMRNADTLIMDGKTLATWKAHEGRKVFDGKRFEADHPDMAEQYRKTAKPYRTFLVK